MQRRPDGARSGYRGYLPKCLSTLSAASFNLDVYPRYPDLAPSGTAFVSVTMHSTPSSPMPRTLMSIGVITLALTVPACGGSAPQPATGAEAKLTMQSN